MSVCRGGGYKITVVKDKIVEASIGACVNSAKKVLTRALPDEVSNANNNVNNSDIMSVGWVSSGIDLVINSKIVKLLTETKVDGPKVVNSEVCGAGAARVAANRGLMKENDVKAQNF